MDYPPVCIGSIQISTVKDVLGGNNPDTQNNKISLNIFEIPVILF